MFETAKISRINSQGPEVRDNINMRTTDLKIQLTESEASFLVHYRINDERDDRLHISLTRKLQGMRNGEVTLERAELLQWIRDVMAKEHYNWGSKKNSPSQDHRQSLKDALWKLVSAL